MLFKYIAMDHKGIEVERTISADDRRAAIDLIRGRGLYPVDIKEVKDSKDEVRLLKQEIAEKERQIEILEGTTEEVMSEMPSAEDITGVTFIETL